MQSTKELGAQTSSRGFPSSGHGEEHPSKHPSKHRKLPQARRKGALLALAGSRQRVPQRADEGRDLQERSASLGGASVRDTPQGADCRPSAPPLVSLSALTAVRHAAEDYPSAVPTQSLYCD